jgi:hypothetical protein
MSPSTSDSAGVAATNPNPRIRGTVSRWGPRGFGFITARELPRAVWCHVNSVVDPGIDRERPLPVGMELEFEAVELEGGKLQAIHVTRPGFSQRVLAPSQLRGAIKGVERLRSVVAVAPDPIPPPPQPSTPIESVSSRTIAERVTAERERIESERTRLDAEAQRLARRAEAAEAQLPDVVRDFEEKIAELEAERDRQIAQLRGDVDKYKAQAQSAAAARDALPAVSVASTEILAQHVRNLRTEFGTRVDGRVRSHGEVGLARRAAVAAVGEGTVIEYEEIRRRRTGAADPLAAKAYAMAEEAARIRLPAYANALDGVRTIDATRVPILVVAAPGSPTRLLLLAPLAPEDAERGDDLQWRVAAFLFDAAERAAREMDANVSVGRAADCLAVDLRPWGAEPELVGIALQEAWDMRPSLSGASMIMSWELLPGVDPPFIPVEPDSEVLERRLVGPAVGGDLRTVARRLRLPLPDLVASLQGAGLPFPDDYVDVGVEESVRQLLNLETEPDVTPAPETVPPPPGSAPSSPPMIARRILQKLLRDSRIGGRHTEAQNVWGHHFADDEKDVAREIMDRLVRRGILMSLRKPGGEHVSIDPRCIDDVKRIIELIWSDASLYEGL